MASTNDRRFSLSFVLALLLICSLGCVLYISGLFPNSSNQAADAQSVLLVQLADGEIAGGEAAGDEQSSRMNNRRLGKLLKKHFPDKKVEGQAGLWRIALDNDAEATEGAESEEGSDNKESKPEENRLNGRNGSLKKEEAGDQQPEEEQALGPGGTNHLPPVIHVMTDERADRMRIMIPIRRFNTQNLENLQLALIVLQANYDRALDARYAVHDGLLWSAFIHPLGSLTPKDLQNALQQVKTLAENTGTSYSSSPMIFAPQGGPQGGPQPGGNQKPGDDIGPGENVT